MSSQDRVCLIHAYPNEYLIESVVAKGYRAVLVNRDPSMKQRFPQLEAQLLVDPADEEAVLRAVQAYHHEKPFTVVLPSNEVTITTSSLAVEVLGLAGNSLSAAQASRDKYLAYRAWSQAGVDTPKTLRITDVARGHEVIARELGWPAVIKIADSMNSQGVIMVEDAAQYRDEVRHLIDLLDEPLDADPNDNRNRAAYGRSLVPILAQEYIEGRELNVDLVYSGDAHWCAGIFEKEEMPGPYFAERASVYPTSFGEADLAQVIQVARRAVAALGAVIGSAHVEIKVVEGRGPVVIEAGLRPGGGLTVNLIERLTGVNLYGLLLDVHRGHNRLLEGLPEPQGACLFGGIVYEQSGRLRSIQGAGEIARTPGLIFHAILGREGDRVRAMPKSAQPHFAYYAIAGSSREEIRARHAHLQRTVQLEIDPI